MSEVLDGQEDLNQENDEQQSEGVAARLLNSLPNEESETEETEEEAGEQSEESEEETETEESTEEGEIGEIEITEELATQLGLPNTFIGKPLSEAGKAYKNAVKWENKNNEEIKELRTTLETLVSQLSDKDINKIEQEANKEAADNVPDPVTEPERFNEWLSKRDELIVQKVLAKVDENPKLKAADEMAQQQMENNTIEALDAGLPEDVEAATVLNDWFEDNKEDYEDMVKSGLYKNKPQKLVKDILTWYKANSFDSLSNTKESDIKKQVHKKTVENLKAKGNKTKTNMSSNARPKQGDNTAVGRILANLEKTNELKS